MKTKSFSMLACVLAVFGFAFYLHSAEQKGTPADIAGTLFVPETYGTVEEVFQGKDKRLVIHIQDAHTDGKAQENIAAILDKLLFNYNIDSIWVEGGSGVIDTSVFASFPAEKTKEALSKLYMNEGVVSGPEYFSINAKKFVHLFGAEEMQLYMDNVKAFKDLWADHQNVKAAIDGMRDSLQLLKNQVYPAALKEIDDRKTAFEKGELPFSAYCEFLKGECVRQGIDLQKFPDFGRLFTMLTAEKAIDFDKIEPERIALIEQLADKLNREKLTQLTQNSLLFRVGRMTPVKFYGSLKELADSEKIALGKNLEAYTAYLGSSTTVDRTQANRDREMIEDALYAKLCGTGEARQVSVLSKDFRVMERFLTLRLSRRDLDFYLKNKEACAPATLESGLKDSLLKSGLQTETLKTSTLAPAVDIAGRFYDIAVKRDDLLVKNLLDGMNAIGKDKAILVSGGFHTDGIKKMLRDKGISYVVILPKVSPLYNETKYASLMLDENTPYLDFFKKRKAPDALPGSIGMAAVHERAEAALATETRFGKDAIGQNFALEILTALPSLAVGVENAQPADLAAGWLKNLQEKIAAALDVEKGVFKAGVASIEGVQTFPPLKLNNNELYVPVRIGERTLALKVYRGDAYKPAAGLVGNPCPVTIAGNAYAVQACDEAGFVDAIISANALLANAAAPAYLNSLGSDVKGAMVSAVSKDVITFENDTIRQKYPVSKDPSRIKVLIYDLDKYETMVGLAVHLQELKKDPMVRVVLVTEYPDVKKLAETLMLEKDVQYDEIIRVDAGAKNIMEKVVGAVTAAFPDVARQDEYTKKDMVIVTPSTARYGAVAADRTINGTPVVVPNVTPAEDEIVSVKQILLYAKLVLANDGDIAGLVAAILKDPSDYPDLKDYLTAQGITTETAVQDLIYNPAPVKVPTGSAIGTEVKGYIEFLKAA